MNTKRDGDRYVVAGARRPSLLILLLLRVLVPKTAEESEMILSLPSAHVSSPFDCIVVRLVNSFDDSMVGNGVSLCIRCDLMYCGGNMIKWRNLDIELWKRSGHTCLCQSMNSLRLTVADDTGENVDTVACSPYSKC